MQPIAYLSGLAFENRLGNSDEYGLQVRTIADAGAAIFILLFITTISVYKPWGLIKRRTVNAVRTDMIDQSKKSFGKYVLITLAILVLIIILMHVFGGGMGHK